MTRRQTLTLGSACLALLGVSGALAIGARGWTWSYRESRSTSHVLEPTDELLIRLDGSTAYRNVGDVAAGSRAVFRTVVLNPTDQPVRIRPVGTSCKCLHLVVPPNEIAGGERVTADIVLDFGHQPGYRGDLMLTAEGSSAEGRALFTLQLDVSVR